MVFDQLFPNQAALRGERAPIASAATMISSEAPVLESPRKTKSALRDVDDSQEAERSSGPRFPMAHWLVELGRRGRGSVRPAVARQGFLSIADQTVASATNFLTGVIIARSCAREEFALYCLGFTIVLFVIGIQNALVVSPFIVYVQSLKGTERRRYAGNSLIHQGGICLLTAGGLMIAGLLHSAGVGLAGLGPVVWSLSAMIALIMLREYMRQMAFCRFRMGTALVLDSCVAVLQLGGLVLLGTWGVLSAANAYWVIGVASGTAALMCIFCTRRDYLLGLHETLKDLEKNWSFGKWVAASSLAALLGTYLYLWFIAVFHGPEAMAAFAACLFVVGIANPLLMGIYHFLMPKTAHAFAHGGLDALQRVTWRSTLVIAVAMGAFVVCLFLVGDQIVTFVYGSGYAGYGQIVALLALSIFAAVLSKPLDYSLRAMGRPKANFVVGLIELGILATVGLWLVKDYGLLGASLGMFGGKLTMSTARYFMFRIVARRHSVSLQEPGLQR